MPPPTNFTLTTARLQIERTIVRYRSGATEAEFMLLTPPRTPGSDHDRWFCCRAWVDSQEPRIQARSNAMTPAQAKAVEVAISMAIDWVGEEMQDVQRPAVSVQDPTL